MIDNVSKERIQSTDMREAVPEREQGEGLALVVHLGIKLMTNPEIQIQGTKVSLETRKGHQDPKTRSRIMKSHQKPKT